MKKTFLVASFLLMGILACQAQLNAINDIFDKYLDAEGVTSVSIGKPMFRMLNNLKIDDDDLQKIKPLLKDISSIKLLIFDQSTTDSVNNASNAPSKDLSKEIFSAVKKLHYEELMSVNTKGQKIHFLTDNASSNILNSLVLSITGKSQNILMLLDGKINIDDITKLANDK